MFSVAVDVFVNCCNEHVKSATLLVANDSVFYSECGETSIFNSPHTTLTFQCTPPRSGKYVLLEFLGQQWNTRPPASSVAVSGFGKLKYILY